MGDTLPSYLLFWIGFAISLSNRPLLVRFAEIQYSKQGDIKMKEEQLLEKIAAIDKAFSVIRDMPPSEESSAFGMAMSCMKEAQQIYVNRLLELRRIQSARG